MNTTNVRSIFRIVGVLTMFAAAIGFSLTLVGIWVTNALTSEYKFGEESLMPLLFKANSYALLTWLVISSWGLVLYVLAPFIARNITSEPTPATIEELPRADGELAHG